MELRKVAAWLFLVLYLIDVALCVVANVLDITLFIVFTKILIIPLLLLYLFVRTNLEWMRAHILFVIGLIFAWGGDVALLVDHENAFYVGLGLFFVTHVLYSISFIRHAVKQHVAVLVLAGLFYAIATVVTAYLISKVETPIVVTIVIFYIVAVAVMATTATNLNVLGAFGGLAFAISDGLIALGKFGTWSWIPEDNIIAALVIAFYGVAQVLLACALVRSSTKKTSSSLNDEYGYDVPMIVTKFNQD